MAGQIFSKSCSLQTIDRGQIEPFRNTVYIIFVEDERLNLQNELFVVLSEAGDRWISVQKS